MVGPQQTTGLIGQKWKTGNGWELTGTNRPTQTTPPTHPPATRTVRKGDGKDSSKREASTIRSTPNPPHTQHTTPTRGVGERPQEQPHNRIQRTHYPYQTSRWSQRQGTRPAPIPNPEAKPDSADGTAPARVRESRTPPSTHHQPARNRNITVPSRLLVVRELS